LTEKHMTPSGDFPQPSRRSSLAIFKSALAPARGFGHP
jgi:hypothetical protein